MTFSCYRRMPLLTNDEWRKMLCVAIDRAIKGHHFRLIAFVLMPEHVHLLVVPVARESQVDDLLFAIKRPYSYRIKQWLMEHDSSRLEKLTIHERPGKTAFRYWQEGPGYDRNLSGEPAIMRAIDYIHENPVRRGLVPRARDWKWSSARWYESERQEIDLDLPTLHGLPWEFFV